MSEIFLRKGYNPTYGARPLKRFIQTKIMNSVANMIISGEMTSGGEIFVDVQNGELTIDAKSKTRGKSKKIEINKELEDLEFLSSEN